MVLLLLQCKRRHTGLVPCRVLSCVSVVLTIRWCVLMSVFGPLLDTLLDFLSKNCGWVLLKSPPTGLSCRLSCSYATKLPVQWWIQNSFSLKYWGGNLYSSLEQDMYTVFARSFPALTDHCWHLWLCLFCWVRLCFQGMTVPALLWPQSSCTMWPHSFITCRKRKCCLRCVNYCCLLLLVRHLGQLVLSLSV